MGFPYSKRSPLAGLRPALISILFIFIALHSAPAAAAFPDQASCLMQIKESSLHFGRLLEEVVFNEGISSAEVRDVVSKINDWLDKNCYPRINEFLDSLDEDDVKAIYDLFSRGADVKSSAELPIFEDLSEKGQVTVLSPPFKGEVKVEHYNGATQLATGTLNSWKFKTTRPAASGKTTQGAKAYFSAIAPAPGQPVFGRDSGCSTGTVFFGHGNGEESRFFCVNYPEEHLKDNELVPRYTPLADVTPSEGETLFFEYEFIKAVKGKPVDFQPRFALYFALGENEDSFRLVLSGVPQPGQFLMDHETYMQRNSR